MDQKQSEEREQIKEMGSLELGTNKQKDRIKLLTIIGEIEGHETVSGNTKATKYEHLLPVLAEIEDAEEIDGLLVLLHTLGGDVEAGLSIAEMIARLASLPYRLFLEAAILSADRLQYQPDILLLFQAARWLFIRCVRTACLSAWNRAFAIC